MKKKKQLSRLLMLREIQYQQESERLAKEQGQLGREEERLKQLEHYQQTYAWQQGRQADGLTLNSAQMMVHSVDMAVRHQRQQVAVQQVQCRSARERVFNEKKQLRTAEVLMEKHQRVLDKKSQKSEQKVMDEISSRLAFSAGNGW